MSVSGISSASFAQVSPPNLSVRQQEDAAWRQLEQGLQSGNLSAAQQAYNTLASFGPNNSGPFVNTKQAAEFQALGQTLQAGDLSGAQQQASQIAHQQLVKDFTRYQQDSQAGNPAGGQALSNLQGDAWAVFGPNQPSAAGAQPNSGTAPSANAINLQA